MRALLVQSRPIVSDPEANLAALEAVLAAHPGADLAVFPELYLSGYDLACAPALALAADGEMLGRLRSAARRHDVALLVGFAERTDAGVANAAAGIDRDGSLAGVYRKTHLFGADEQRTFVAGDTLLVIELAGVRVAPLICFDMEFVEPARGVARAGAQLLVTVAANMEPYGPDHALAARARALDNRLAHLYVNQVGTHAGLTFVGGTCAVGGDGALLAVAEGGETVLAVDVPEPVRPAAEVDYLRLARPELSVEVLIPEPIAERGA